MKIMTQGQELSSIRLWLPLHRARQHDLVICGPRYLRPAMTGLAIGMSLAPNRNLFEPRDADPVFH